MRVVPRPTCDAALVVVQHPLKALNVVMHHLATPIFRRPMQLVAVVPILPCIVSGRVVGQQQSAHRRRHHRRCRRRRGRSGITRGERRFHRRSLGLLLAARIVAVIVSSLDCRPAVACGYEATSLLCWEHPKIRESVTRAARITSILALLKFLRIPCSIAQHSCLRFGKRRREQLEAREVKHTTFRNEPSARSIGSTMPRNKLLVHSEYVVERALIDIKRRKRRKKVVSYEHAQEDKVVDDALLIHHEIGAAVCNLATRRRCLGSRICRLRGKKALRVLFRKIVAQKANLQEHEGVFGRVLEHLSRRLSAVASGEGYHLAQQHEVRLVRSQGKHDEVCVESVHAVPNVRRVVAVRAFGADVLHDFVLTLAGHLVAVENHLHVTPRAGLQRPRNVRLQVPRQHLHERSAGRDAVRVEAAARLWLHTPVLALILFSSLGSLNRRTESARTLLVHLGTRRASVDGEVDELPWSHDGNDCVKI